jgi:peptide-methionine (S)-S-oxide reductase
MKKHIILSYILLICSLSGFAFSTFKKKFTMPVEKTVSQTDTATFASGCFWCEEAKFSQLKGVIKVTSGYTGGLHSNPSYEQV